MKTSIFKTCALAALLLFVGCKTRPEACFQVVEPDFVVPDRPIQFEDCSLNGSSWSWDFGDGTSSTDRNPQKVYTSPGTYQVKQVVENEKGKVDSSAIDLEVSSLSFESITLSKFPDLRPNGTPWDPDLSGPDVSLKLAHSSQMPFSGSYLSPIIQNVQTQLPFRFDLASSNVNWRCCDWFIILLNHSTAIDTVAFWSPPYEEMLLGGTYSKSFGDSLEFQITFKKK